MNSIFFNQVYKFQDYALIVISLLLILVVTETSFAQGQGLVKVRRLGIYSEYIIDNKRIILDNKNKTVIVLQDKKSLQISKAKDHILYSYSQQDKNRYLKIFFKKSLIGKQKSLVGFVSEPKKKYFFSDYKSNCFEQTNKMFSFIKQGGLEPLIEGMQIDKLIDQKSCKNIPFEKVSEMTAYLRDKIENEKSKLKLCLDNPSVLNVLDNDWALRENMALFVGRFLGILNSLKQGGYPVDIGCEASDDQNKMASIDTKFDPPKMLFYFKSGKFNMIEGDGNDIINHELFHFGVPQIPIGEDPTCIDEEYAKLVTNLCANKIDILNTKLETSASILKKCVIGVDNYTASIKDGYLVADLKSIESTEGLFSEAANAIEATIATRTGANQAESQMLAAVAKPQDFKPVVDGDVERVLATVPALFDKANEQVIVPAAIFGGSIERIASAGEATIKNIGEYISEGATKASKLVVNQAVGVNSNSESNSVGVYPLASIISDVYSTSSDRPSLLIREQHYEKNIKASILSRNAPTNSEISLSAAAIIPAKLSAQKSEFTVTDQKDSIRKISEGNVPVIKRSVASISPLQAEAQQAVTVSPNPNNLVADRITAPQALSKIDNQFLQGLSVYKTIKGDTYKNFKSYYTGKSADAELLDRGIYIYDENNKPIAGQAVNAKICFRDLMSSGELMKEKCPSIKKR